MKGYVYKFYDKRGNIIYIGVTGNIKARMCQHFTKKDLYDTAVIPKDKIGDIVRVEYTETRTMANARILEAYLIAKNKPLYNSDFVEGDDLTYELVTGDLKWKEYPIYRGENPNQDLRIYDTWGKLLYEIPYIKAFYEAYQEMLGIDLDLSQIGHNTKIENNGYVVVRINHVRDYWKRKREGTWQAQQQA